VHPVRADAERFEQVAFEAAQRPRQRLAAAQALAGQRVGRMQFGQGSCRGANRSTSSFK
jgi:hypothetical protein